MINKVVIPLAGLGTRMFPITKYLSKEMLPIVNIPSIIFILSELTQTTISHFLFIINNKKTDLNNHIKLYLKNYPNITFNFIEQKDVNKLRIEMSKQQVAFLIGRPILDDTFGGDNWRYIYRFKSGHNAKVTYKELILTFKQNKLTSAEGDYQLSDEFSTPLAQ